ncbi:hypothetical protein F2Q68_00006011 [Brassica cretica]|uniref:DUF4283 domain-containing protein n=1 Tax=Brassica cretica TaxID=69181 RepID=A0A8S9JNB8_BRACR|nr:hypothetical protein F2Q68_00006011 [Brassica cretica]
MLKELASNVTGTSLPNSSTVFSSPVKARSENTVHLDLEKLKVLPPKFSSPIISNKASNAASSSLPPSSVAPTNHKKSPKSKTLPSNPTATAPSSIPTSQTSTSPFPPSQTCDFVNPDIPPPVRSNLAEKLRKTQDKSLTRLAPVTISDTGRPRVLIPDSVFHKDFIICYFNGRPPPFNHVQNVLNHLWGKGIRVEIHTNPLSRSMLVRIPSDYLRQKILQKRVWYVGDSMFQAVQWTSSASSSSPPLESIQIWAHLQGVPLDLRHQQGLSLVAGLVGEPKETDDFTLNLVSLTMSHVKVSVDLTKPLPSVVEFTRQSGEVVEVLVTYPWIPPTCSHCKELGHVMRNCLKLPPPPKKQPPPPRSSNTPRKNPSEPAEVAPVKNKDDICKTPSVTITGATSSSSNATLKGKGVAESPNPPTLPPIPAPSSSSNSANTPSLPPPRPVSIVDPPDPSTTKKPDSQLVPYLSSPLSPPSPPEHPKKRPRPNPSIQQFSTFTDQLKFFSSPTVQAMQSPSSELFELEKEVSQRWHFLRMIEESYFKQRSRINWLKEGDLNTTYFFRIVQTRLNYNTITSFLPSSGVILSDPLDMSSHAIQHFTSILGPCPTPMMGINSPPAWFNSLVPYSCSPTESLLMTSIPTSEEISSVVHKLNANKAPLGQDLGLLSVLRFVR